MQFQREELLIGKDNVEKLKNSHIIIFGLGGVGGFTVEALVRAGVGEITVVDFDTVDITNLNRQIIATHDSVGKDKVKLIEERALSINPNIKVNAIKEMFSSETADLFFKDKTYSYAVDAIDLVTCKLYLVKICKEKNIPILSSMGTGNKLNHTMLKVADINKTSVCPLARVMRKELKKRRIKKLKVIYSTEVPKKPFNDSGTREKMRNIGSVSFVKGEAKIKNLLKRYFLQCNF